MKRIRVGFPLISSAEWTGGFNYLHNLLSAITDYQLSKIKPVLFCGLDASDGDVTKFEQLEHVQIVRCRAFNTTRRRASLREALLKGVDSGVLGALRAQEIDVVFENATFYGWRLPIPAIAWFPDFQHRRLREYFSMFAFIRREIGFRVQIASSRIIMLSSEDARSDCERFYPSSIGRTTVVRFASPIDSRLITENPTDVLQEYGIKAPFFYLPNQFWKHKNHNLLIESLALLKNEGCNPLVLVTGNPNNFLHPEIYTELKQRVIKMGLESNMRFLGMVPRAHVISLMRTCLALINPSFFEGWSSTVEEARALGVPMLLSDIAVHREQMGTAAKYFSPSEPADLSQLMREYMQAEPSATEPRCIQTDAAQNVARFASGFVETVERVIR